MSSFGYDPRRLRSLKPACALVDTGRRVGTGFLIDGGRLLTCSHVMDSAEKAQCRFGDDRSKLLEFRVVARYDDVDSAVLEATDVDALAHVAAPNVKPTSGSLDDWWGWGFPAVVDGQGLPLWGQIGDEDAVGPDGRHSIQLFAANLVGEDAQLGGLSGSPVLIRDNVFGMIYRVLGGGSSGQQARFGMVYAIPIGPAHPAFGGARSSALPKAHGAAPAEPTELEWEQLRLFALLKMASSVDGVRKVLAQWQSKNAVPMPANVPDLAAERLIAMGSPSAALEVLGNHPTRPRAIQMSAVALSLLGKADEGRALIATLPTSAESGGIVGGIYKRKYLETGNRVWLQASYNEYERTYEAHPDPYPGINAAATALWLGKQDLSRARAQEVRTLLENKPETKRDHWNWATLGEAAMLSGDMNTALGFYEKAAAVEPSHGRDIAVMRRQVRLNSRALNASADPLEAVLSVGGVACFTGHRLDEPGRQSPRFPRDRVHRVAERIKKALDDANVRFGFSSAADGGDILFVEQLLARGGEPTVILPFPAEDFAETSVDKEWRSRFHSVLSRLPAGSIHVIESRKPTESDLENVAYAQCNERIQEAAIEAGRIYDEPPRLIAVLSKSSERVEVGGSADAVRRWKEQLNGEVVLIDPLD